MKKCCYLRNSILIFLKTTLKFKDMKKFGFKSMAVFALAAATVFTSCKKDDDGTSVLDLVSRFEVTSGLDGFKTNNV